MTRRVRVVLALLLGLVVLAGGASTALAHAELESSSPEAGSVLTESPTQIVLTFSEDVDPVADSIRLVTADGTDVALDPAGQTLGGDTLSTPVPELEDGTYVVAWRAVSSDSHPISGAFTFSIGVQTATADGLIDQLVEQESTARATRVWLGIGRRASFGGIGVLLGVLVTLGRCAPDALRRRRTTLVLLLAATGAVVGTAVMIVAQAGIIRGASWAPASWRAVAETHAGRWWVVRLVVATLALAGVLTGRHRRRGPDGFDAASQAVFVLWATALLAVVAAGGHGVTGRVVALGFLATWLHLVAMSCWLGGLVSLALLVERRGVRAAAARFSPIALASVVLLAVTGTTNAWRQADSWSALRDSSYGRWLLVKLIVLVGVVAVAAVSRWLVGYAPPGPASDRAVRRAVTVEAIGMAVVLAATAGLVNSPPPREATLAPVTVSDVEGDRIAQIVLDPPVTGGTTMHVYVTSTAGTLLQPTSITVTAGLPERGIAALELVLSPAGPGHLTADDVVLPIAGTWTFTVAARYSEFDETRFVLQATVR